MRERALKNVQKDVKKLLIRRDNLIAQSVKTVDVIDRTTNLLIEQLKDWYAVYFPELAKTVDDPDAYLRFVSELKTKDNFTSEKIKKVSEKEKYFSLAEKSKRSMGADLKEEDINQMVRYADNIRNLRDERKKIDNYLKGIMEEEAPNITAVIGPTIGARLIATAGSLQRLAEFPSSTVQVLGAEKALFSHLRSGTAPPKYGIIFQYPKIRGAPNKKRGKIARRLASKLSIAAKIDFFKGQFIGASMAEELEKDIDRIMKS